MADSDDQKSALILQLAAQRTRLSRHAEGIHESLNVRRRVKASFAGNQVRWLTGAAFAGILLARFRGRKSVKRPIGEDPKRAAAGVAFALPMMKLVFGLARPALVSMLTARIADFASGRPAPRRDAPR